MSANGHIWAAVSSSMLFVGEAKRRKREQKLSFILNRPEVPGSTPLHIVAQALGPIQKQQSIRPGVCVRKRRRIDHAFNSTGRGSGSSWRSAVAGESLHPHGRKHQVDLERGRRHRCGVLAPECIWTVSFPLTDTRWVSSMTLDGSDVGPRLVTSAETTNVLDAASTDMESQQWRQRL